MPDFHARGRQALGIPENGQADPGQGPQAAAGTAAPDPAASTPGPQGSATGQQGQSPGGQQPSRAAQTADSGSRGEDIRTLKTAVDELTQLVRPVDDSLPVIAQIPETLAGISEQVAELAAEVGVDGPLGGISELAANLERRAVATQIVLDGVHEREGRILTTLVAQGVAIAHQQEAIAATEAQIAGHGAQVRAARDQLDQQVELFRQLRAEITQTRTGLGQLRTEFGQLKTEMGQTRAALGQLNTTVAGLQAVLEQILAQQAQTQSPTT